jgi:hypothetical protein
MMKIVVVRLVLLPAAMSLAWAQDRTIIKERPGRDRSRSSRNHRETKTTRCREAIRGDHGEGRMRLENGAQGRPGGINDHQERTMRLIGCIANRRQDHRRTRAETAISCRRLGQGMTLPNRRRPRLRERKPRENENGQGTQTQILPFGKLGRKERDASL